MSKSKSTSKATRANTKDRLAMLRNNDGLSVSDHDRKGIRKHRKMRMRAMSGGVHPNCKWAKNSHNKKDSTGMSSQYEVVGIDEAKEAHRGKRLQRELKSAKQQVSRMSKTLGKVPGALDRLKASVSEIEFRIAHRKPKVLYRRIVGFSHA